VESIVKMDKQGRILIPIEIRKKISSRVFIVNISNDEIVLKPIKDTKLTDFFDSIEVDVDDFTDTHKLRKALLEGRK